MAASNQFNLSHSLGGIDPTHLDYFFYNARNTFAVPMKFCPKEQYLVVNILNSEEFMHLATMHEQDFHNRQEFIGK